MLHSHGQDNDVSAPSRRGAILTLFGVFTLWAAGVLMLFPSGGFFRQSSSGEEEARNELRALAEAQMAHFRAKGMFSYDFNAIGYLPAPPMRYVIAFPEACALKHVSPTAVISSLEMISRGTASSDSRPRTLTVGERERISKHLQSLGPECPDPSQGFVALAVGNIDDDDDLDVWSIDRDFNLNHLQTDL